MERSINEMSANECKEYQMNVGKCIVSVDELTETVLVLINWDPCYKQFMQLYAMTRALRDSFQRRNFIAVAFNFQSLAMSVSK